MTTRQSAESNMLEILGLYLEKNKAVTDVLKMIGKGAAKLAARKSNIDALEKLQSGTTKGVTAVKKTTLEQIKLAGETHRSNLIGFATDANKLDSFADFVMSPTAFKTGGEVKIMARCKDLLTATRTVETDANAAIYKLSKTDNDEFETLLNSYKPKKIPKLPKKIRKRKLRSTSNRNLTKFIKS